MEFIERIRQKLSKILRDENDKIVARNTVLAVMIKGMALVVSLLATPTFIKYFDNNVVLGIWYTVLSVLTWVLSFDLGIGNGLRNSLVGAFVKKDDLEAKKYISSAVFALGALTLICGIVGAVAIGLFDWNSVLNIETDVISRATLTRCIRVVLAGIIVKFFLNITDSVIYALQKSFINNLNALIVSCLQLTFLMINIGDSAEQKLLYLSFAYVVFLNLPPFVTSVILLLSRLRRMRPNIMCVDREHVRAVMSVGLGFFFCQIMYMLLINTNEFFITRLFGSEFTVEYQIYFKITSLIFMVFSLALTPLWSAVAKAANERNTRWLRTTLRRLQAVGLLAVALEFVVAFCMSWIVKLWLRENAIQINIATALAFSVFGSAFIYQSILSTLVCGLGEIKLQAVCYTVGVIVKTLIIVLCSKYVGNWSLVVWANALVLIPYCLLEQRHIHKLIAKINE